MSSVVVISQPLSLHIRLLSFVITCTGFLESIIAICAITLIPALSPNPPPLVIKTRRCSAQAKSGCSSARSVESTSTSIDDPASELVRGPEKLVFEIPTCNSRKLSSPFSKFSFSSPVHPPSFSPFARRLSLPGRRPITPLATPTPSPLTSSSYFTYHSPIPSPALSSTTRAFRLATESNLCARSSAGVIDRENVLLQKISKKAKSVMRLREKIKTTS